LWNILHHKPAISHQIQNEMNLSSSNDEIATAKSYWMTNAIVASIENQNSILFDRENSIPETLELNHLRPGVVNLRRMHHSQRETYTMESSGSGGRRMNPNEAEQNRRRRIARNIM
jgi:hypothetical protein